MAAEDEQEQQKTETKAKKSGGNLVVIICGIAVMILSPLSSYLVVKMNQPKEEESSTEQSVKAGNPDAAPITVPLESMVVNIKDTRMTRILRIVPYLIVDNKLLEAVITELKPLITDRIIMIASEQTLDTLDSKEDREALKLEIVNGVNELVRDRGQGSILDVAFGDFLIQ